MRTRPLGRWFVATRLARGWLVMVSLAAQGIAQGPPGMRVEGLPPPPIQPIGGGSMGPAGGPTSCGLPFTDPGGGARGGGDPDVLYNQGGTGDTQDGGLCGFEPASLVPEPKGVAANTSLIGAAPFDLGALQRGAFGPPVVAIDGGATLVALVLAQTPLADDLGYGASFALGGGGTVAPSSGAFVHPFTLLELPSAARRMGLLLRAVHVSNGDASPVEPFGAGFYLSGYDVLDADAPGSGWQSAMLYRGDGQKVRYDSSSGSPPGVFDALAWNATAGRFERDLLDGRVIRYVYFGQVGGVHRYLREMVLDRYGNRILYTFTPGTTELAKITDTRGVDVVLAWATVAGARRVAGISVVPPNPPGDVPAADLEIDLAYDSSARLARIRLFPTQIVDDTATNPGRYDLPAEVQSRRPSLEIVYDGGGRVAKVRDVTVSGKERTRIENQWSHDIELGWVVTEQWEGDRADPSAPKHTFAYPSSGQRTYTGPQGTVTTMDLDANARVTKVTMTAGAAGKPRDADGFTASLGDHASLTWNIGYAACCALPATIEVPKVSAGSSTGKTYVFTWDATRGLLTGLDVQPEGSGSSQHVRFEYVSSQNGDTDLITGYHVLASGGGGVKRVELSFGYTVDPNANHRITRVTMRTRGYKGPRDSVTQAPIVRTLDLGPRGEVTRVTDGEGTVTTFAYEAAPDPGAFLPRTVVVDATGAALRRSYTIDDLGRVSRIDLDGDPGSTGRTWLTTVDVYHHLRAATSPAGPGGAGIRTERYHDRTGNLAVVRKENRDETGALRGRAWIQTDRFFDARDRLEHTNVDQAPLDAAQEDVLTTSYSYRADHTLERVTLPSGAVTRMVHDGYGFVYKVVLDEGGLDVVRWRYWYDARGGLTTVMDGLGEQTAIVRDGLSHVREIVDPTGRGKIVYDRDELRRLVTIHARDVQAGVDLERTRLVYDSDPTNGDELGRLIRIERWLPVAGGAAAYDATLLVRNRRGQLTEIARSEDSGDVDPAGGFRRSLTAGYDGAGRLSWMEDRLSESAALRNRIDLVYESGTGRLHKRVRREIRQAPGDYAVPLGSGTAHVYEEEYAYDALDRLVTAIQHREQGSTSGPATIQRSYAYDAFGLVESTDAGGARLRWLRDPLGRVRRTEEIGVQGGEIVTTTTYVVDATETRVDRVDAEGRSTRFLYDRALRLVESASLATRRGARRSGCCTATTRPAGSGRWRTARAW